MEGGREEREPAKVAGGDMNIVGSSLPGDGRSLCHMDLCGGLQTGALGSEVDKHQMKADVDPALAFEKAVPCNATKISAHLR